MSSNAPFIRTVELLVGPLTEDQGGGNPNQAFRIFSTGDRKALRVKFSVKKTLLSVPNESVIEIFNMSRESIERIRKTLSKVQLQVGWENTELRLMAQGAIKNIETERRGADLVTRLVMYDGLGGQLKGVVNRTYGPRTPILDIIKDVASKMPGVNLGDLDVDGIIGSGGLSVSDRSADVLDRLSSQFGFSWSIQDGTFQAIQDTRALSRVVELSSRQRNLIKASPILQSPEQEQVGIEIEAILNPRVRPGHQVKLTSDLNPRLNGFYKVHTVDFDGDSGGENWTMKIKSIGFKDG